MCMPALHIKLTCKTRVYMGAHILFIFTLKQRLGLLADVVLTCIHNLCFEQKYERYKKIKKISFQFSQLSI